MNESALNYQEGADYSSQGNVAQKIEHRKLVYLVEDDYDLQSILTFQLNKQGYHVKCFDKAEDVIEKLEAMNVPKPDAFIVDVNLAGTINGMDFTKLLRERRDTSNAPVMMLTARGESKDVISGLKGGADDYLPKPFEMDVLMARVDSLVRRVQRNNGRVFLLKSKLNLSGIEVDPNTRQVVCDGQLLELTYSEFGILFNLMSKPNTVFDRDELLLRVMGRSKSISSRTIDVHIRALRKKLGRSKEKHIHTIRGVGYKFIP